MSRIQLALNVDDVEAATAFYARLFGAEPAKTRPGYANFALTDPSLKLVLLENPGQGGTLNHLGIEVGSVDDVDAAQTRLAGLGLASVDERGTTCCYATQDKFWVEGTPGESAGRSTRSSPTARPSSASGTPDRRAAPGLDLGPWSKAYRPRP